MAPRKTPVFQKEVVGRRRIASPDPSAVFRKNDAASKAKGEPTNADLIIEAKKQSGRPGASEAHGQEVVDGMRELIRESFETWWIMISKALDMRPTKFGEVIMGQASYINKALKAESASPNIINLMILDAKTRAYAAKQGIEVPSFWKIFAAKTSGTEMGGIEVAAAPVPLATGGQTVDIPCVTGGMLPVSSSWLAEKFPANADRLKGVAHEGVVYLIDPETPTGGSDCYRMLSTDDGYVVVEDWNWVAREGRAEIIPADHKSKPYYVRRQPDDLGRIVAVFKETTTVQLGCVSYTP